MTRLPLLALAVAAAAPSYAQTLKGVTLEPAAVKVGENVTIRAGFELGDTPNCAVRIHFGDAAITEAKINQAKDATLAVTHRYARPGQYTIMVEPKRVGATLKCQGPNARAQLSVTASTAAAPTARQGSPAPACPPGWTLDSKSVNARTGAFRCNAAPGAPAPATRLSCPGTLSYVENLRKGLIACQP